MAKNPNKKVAPKDEPMNGAMKFFLAGCVAELYLLILRRFYINADSELTRIAWYDHYLWTLAGIGAGVLAVGVIAALVLRSSAKKQKSAWILAAAGAFVGAATALVRWNMATLSFMTIVVPVIMLPGMCTGSDGAGCLSLCSVGRAPVRFQHVCGHHRQDLRCDLSGSAGSSRRTDQERQAE